MSDLELHSVRPESAEFAVDPAESGIDPTLPDAAELPTFRCGLWRPRRSSFMVLIPVINEGERILGQLARMRAADLNLDILIVDGGSTDGSTEPRRLRRDLGVAGLLVKTGPGKLSAQLRLGMAWALSRGYEGIVTIDGNGKDDVRAIPSFAAALGDGHDHLQGSRYIHGGIAENTPLDRELAVRLLHAPLISAAARYRYTDTTNGFRGYSRKLLMDPRVRPFRAVFATYNLHYYLAIRAARLGFKVAEIPVTRRYPLRGELPSKIGGWRGKVHILAQTVHAALGSYDPKEGS
jgi:dolichol-phosphate mannosyltransferase